jgi:hypothetical protein
MKRPCFEPRRPDRLALTTTAILLGLATSGWAQVVPPTAPPADAPPPPTTSPIATESIVPESTEGEDLPLAETPADPVDLAPETPEVLLEPLEEEPLPTETLEDLDTPGIRTTYLPSRLPWESPEVPDIPEWRANSSRFQNPAFGTSALGDSLPSGGSGLSRRTASNPIRLSLFDIYPSVGYQASYATDLRSDSSSPTSDTWIHTFSPVVRIRAGSHWQLIYSPRIRFFSDDQFNSAVNHTVGLSGWATYQDWTFSLNHRTAINNDPLIETGSQTKQSTHSTSIGASWDRDSRGAYDFSLTQNLRLTDDNNDTYSWDLQTAYTYPLNDRIRVGGIFSVGYDLAPDAIDMINERVNAFVSGPLGNKISYTLTGGVEFRQFVDSDADTTINPLVSLNLTYRVLSRTTLSLGVNHSTSTSYFSNQFTENTTVQAILNQGITDRWSASINGGLRFRSYQSTAASNTVQREDTTSFIGGSINGRLTQRITTSARYEFRMNDSDAANRDFESHQITLGLNWAL